MVHATLEKRDYTVEQLIATAEADRATLKEHLKKLDRQSGRKYNVQRATFVLGLAALLVSRGYVTMWSILIELRA